MPSTLLRPFLNLHVVRLLDSHSRCNVYVTNERETELNVATKKIELGGVNVLMNKVYELKNQKRF